METYSIDDETFCIKMGRIEIILKKGDYLQPHNSISLESIIDNSIPITIASKNQRRWFNIASELALSSPFRVKHGAVIVKSGRIIGSGFNHDRYGGFGTNTFTNYGKLKYSTHAEVDALHDTGDFSKLRGATMYITRRDKKGCFRYSAPCHRCQSILSTMKDKWGLSRIIFTLDSESNKTELLPIVEFPIS